ncbi:MAG: rhodanese-like domain-containing protein [Chloroflexota bacterium]|nr:rhodanese-like domain-containing protein [Chloroflexota bacterium]
MFNNFFGGNSRELPYTEITPQQADQKRQSSEQVVVVDVREPYEYSEGHIPGSKLAPLGQLTQHLNELGTKEQELIVVCRSGGRSSQAARQLASLGYKKISNLSGGMMAWMRAGLPSER